MDQVESLEQARQQLKLQAMTYQPTTFWGAASEKITEELKTYGLAHFRRIPSALGYFVPNYSGSASGITPEQALELRAMLEQRYPTARKSQQALHHFLSGTQAALSDYRVFLASQAAECLPHLHNFSESTYGSPTEQFEWNGKRFSRSALNYLLGLCFLKRHLRGDFPRVVLEIGGGFGTLGEIWSQSDVPGWQYINVDIPPTQGVAEYYLKKVLGEDHVTGFGDIAQSGTVALSSLKPAAVLCSWQIEQLIGQVDLFVNFISFQEMEPEVVQNYLRHVDRLEARWVLLRNLREGKQKKSGSHVGVETPIRTDDYLAMLTNYDLIERNVHPFGFQTVDGFHSELMLLKRR
jgi:putative sugar O-methyltransferase